MSLTFRRLIHSTAPTVAIIVRLTLFQGVRSTHVCLSLLPIIVNVYLTAISRFDSMSFALTNLLLALLNIILSYLGKVIAGILVINPLGVRPLRIV